MKLNVGKTDKIIRTVLGLILVSCAAYFKGALPPAVIWAGIGFGIIFLVTAVVGFCPLYISFGISTCKGSGNNDCGDSGCCCGK